MFCFGFSSGLLFETELMKCRHASNIVEAGSELILLPPPPSAGISGVHFHAGLWNRGFLMINSAWLMVEGSENIQM